jgi:uncharacterized protein
MRKIIMAVAILVSTATLAFAADPWHTETFSLAPKAGDGPYLIEVAFPAAPAPAGGYPVIYVLDAVGSFATVADTVEWQEQLFGPVVVVGIRYENALETKRRTFDLTPKSLPGTEQRSPANVGGEDAFLAFVQVDLKPAIAQRVRVDPTRQALFGHSLAGLFALHVLLAQPQTFDTYVIASPSINLFGQEVLQELPAFQARGVVGPPRRVLITAGGLERSGHPPEELRFAKRNNIPIPPDVAPGHDMISESSAMAKSLQTIKGIQAQFVEFPGETHNSSIPAYIGRGARWTLSGWYP